MQPNRQVILLLAAGASTRMRGTDKLLEEVGGQPLLAERLETALATGAEVIVTLPPRAIAPGRWAAVEGRGATLVEVPDPGSDMAESLKAGIAALPPDAPGVMILLADMPEITGTDLLTILNAFDGETILRGSAEDGTPGHPVLFPARDFATLALLHGDQGAREVLKAERARQRLIALPARHALTDLDTPEDWARWRHDTGR
jgi:molybdenum cofactor cytidylyltransferase